MITRAVRFASNLAAQAAEAAFGLLCAPPRFDLDTPLAEAEEEQEVSEPLPEKHWDCGCVTVGTAYKQMCPDHQYEPPLSEDELVAVRGLIQERYDGPKRADPSPIPANASEHAVGGEGPAGLTHSPESPAGRPTSELLNDAITAILDGPGEPHLFHGKLVLELRDRARTFENIEAQK